MTFLKKLTVLIFTLIGVLVFQNCDSGNVDFSTVNDENQNLTPTDIPDSSEDSEGFTVVTEEETPEVSQIDSEDDSKFGDQVDNELDSDMDDQSTETGGNDQAMNDDDSETSDEMPETNVADSTDDGSGTGSDNPGNSSGHRDHETDHEGESQPDHNDHGTELKYVCILKGPGHSNRLGYIANDEKKTVCMSKNACTDIIGASQMYEIKTSKSTGYCKNKAQFTISFDDNELIEALDL